MTTIINIFTMYLYFIKNILVGLSFDPGPKNFMTKNVPIALQTRKEPMLIQPFQAIVLLLTLKILPGKLL